MDSFQMRLDAEDRAALRAAAAAQGVSEAELVRRLVRRGLALKTADALAEVVALCVRRELAPVRRMGYLAAREATKARYWSRAAAISIYRQADGNNKNLDEWKAQCDDAAIKQALILLRDRDLERTDEQTVRIADMAAILTGGDQDTAPDEEEPVVELTAEEAEPFEGQEDDAGGDPDFDETAGADAAEDDSDGA